MSGRGSRVTAGVGVCVALLLMLLALPAPAAAAAPTPCPGAAMTPDAVYTGDFNSDQEGSFVFLPFDVPPGQTAARVKYCHDQPESPTSSRLRHTLDLGIYDSRPATGALWGQGEFRGWSGSGTSDVTVAPNGYSSSPADEDLTRTDRGYLPGPVPAGEWGAELGLASIVGPEGGDVDGKVNWRVEIDWTDDPAFESQPYQPAAYDSAPAKRKPGWYAGDLHVHAEHSRDARATMRETFDFAFAPQSMGAGLDFVTLSDHNTTSAWGEIGRYQADYPGKLIVRSGEVTTYRGHANNHASARWADYRTGPVYERERDGTLRPLRGEQPASLFLDQILAGGGFTQINHPTLFPSQVPGFDEACRGCSWDYSEGETDYSKVKAIEVQTGPAGLEQEPQPGPNPFTPLAIDFWERKLDAGYKIAPVGGSDSHDAGRTPEPTHSPVGDPTTVLFADELSEAGIKRAIEARHSYVKMFGNDGPDLRFEARAPASKKPAIMGDTVQAKHVSFLARVIGANADPEPYELVVLKEREPLYVVPVTSADFKYRFPSAGSGRYRLQLQRSTAIEGLTSPIWLEP